MTLFYSGSVLLILLAVVFIGWPFIRHRLVDTSKEADAEKRQLTNIALYRDHLSDIEQSLVTGSMTREQHNELKLELERNLLEDSHLSSSETQTDAFSRRYYPWVFAGITCCLVLVAALIYQQLGAYELWTIKSVIERRGQLERHYIHSGDSSLKDQMVSINRQLVTKITTYLENEPNELQMRLLLARTLMSLGNFSLAIEQFELILEQQPNVGQIMAEMAQAFFLQANNRVVPIVQSLVDRTLQLEPNNTVALGLAGIASFQFNQYQQAIHFWQKAINLQGINTPNSKALQSSLAVARQRLAEADGDGAPSSAYTTDESSKQEVLDGDEAKVELQVSLAESVTSSPEDSVFIYARAWQGARVPLAIVRVKAKDLPLDLTLTDAMAMVPGMNLSSVKQLELVARLSKSGDSAPKSGDWQATLGPVNQGDDEGVTYQLVISERIP
ncbi:c-type cytochrome biogenesis protein CcmI [Candidatus Endobugula sertula]|uniref:C-type cytochrome biogenesis protein CcmI n=1 Tax=Candidatus Endobugula sertula TaxID=62101 RepID=A0A1D2QP10_9GAMM|nr:c-type cytochrome biogenesis protein CcmI [Candidatus Endobugula sertula]